VVEQIGGSEGPEVSESYPAVPESVPEARQAVVGLASEVGASDEQVDAIRLATSEAVTNAVVHAYDGIPGLVHVRAEVAQNAIAVSVSDDGAGLRPRLERRGIGLGLALIAAAADEMAIATRPGGGTELRMRFALTPRS
jgi:anti-sigma regulatory factor (Ser/Thr protein kinase)